MSECEHDGNGEDKHNGKPIERLGGNHNEVRPRFSGRDNAVASSQSGKTNR
jgi:hypothetical protein